MRKTSESRFELRHGYRTMGVAIVSLGLDPELCIQVVAGREV